MDKKSRSKPQALNGKTRTPNQQPTFKMPMNFNSNHSKLIEIEGNISPNFSTKETPSKGLSNKITCSTFNQETPVNQSKFIFIIAFRSHPFQIHERK